MPQPPAPHIGEEATAICAECGQHRMCVYGPDPYSEINGDDTPKWLCRDCYLSACDEI